MLRTNLICDGRSIPLLSHIAPSSKQNNSSIQQTFLDALARAINPGTKVVIITDARFKNAWFRHTKSLGWDFVGRIRDNTQLRLESKGSAWLRPADIVTGSSQQPRASGDGNTNEPAAAYVGANKFSADVQRQKRHGCFSAVPLSLNPERL